jgi:ChrR Cupin-like domain
MNANGTHNPPEFKHAADMEWEMGRFGNVTKFLFHPRPERPTEPNAGFLKYAPGASFPLHRHDFAQIWYIVEGEFTFGGKLYGPGTIAYMPDPHFEHEVHIDLLGQRDRGGLRGRDTGVNTARSAGKRIEAGVEPPNSMASAWLPARIG